MTAESRPPNSDAGRVPLLEELAHSPLTPVLVVGPNAAQVARTLHDMTFPNRQAPFVPVDCTWIPANVASELLFGFERAHHVRRGFMERANGGTLFLDDVTELPAPDQARLANTLDSMRFRRNFGSSELEISLRVVAGIRGSVAQALANGCLKRSLHDRLSVFTIVSPG